MQENEEIWKSIGWLLYLTNCIVKFKYKKDRGIVKKILNYGTL